MKKILLLPALVLTLATTTSCDTLHTAVANSGGTIYSPSQTSTPSTLEMISGLKQALEQGTNKSVSQLSAVNGFFGNAAIKLLLPPEAQKAEATLRKLGFNKLCDDAILSLNRAAEDAAGKAAPIFVSAIKQLTVQDVTNILLGGQKDAATNFFKRTTTSQLTEQFKPVINKSLSSVGATKYYGSLVTQYNKIPLVFNKLNPNLDEYVTQKAIDGLFYRIAQEELNIRTNLSSRTTPILQKVFGYVQKKTS
ncbi:DUF4197 domain-containing protein [Mucilaginibacter terrae]|uniref:DUF4197 domain-containing protein n=1 Tax=Mucilaginibacter terrae TaxID=1955052 RepID=A0ABU3GYA7_9SPHI|nr:DUF4197 domain-containing protein [Mucilaginibacter terrae]MDT3403972.1 hypothetical protein [Mucilaginibacter terrae]